MKPANENDSMPAFSKDELRHRYIHALDETAARNLYDELVSRGADYLYLEDARDQRRKVSVFNPVVSFLLDEIILNGGSPPEIQRKIDAVKIRRRQQ